MYNIFDVVVKENDRKNMYVRNEFQLVLNVKTKIKVEKQDCDEIPTYKYNLIPLRIINEYVNQDFLICKDMHMYVALIFYSYLLLFVLLT